MDNRTITNHDELKLLHPGSIVRIEQGPAFWKIDNGDWLATGDSLPFEPGEIPLPATVLWEAEETE